METHNVLYDLSNDEYHHSEKYKDYISSSQLKIYSKSPKAAKYAMEHPTDTVNPALKFGSLFHDMMAYFVQRKYSPESIADYNKSLTVFTAPVNPRTENTYGTTTKQYKEALEAHLSALSDTASLVTDSDFALLSQMRTAIFESDSATSEQVKMLVNWGRPEVSIFYTTEDGVKLKIRPDLLTKNKIVDWKTTTLDDLTEDSLNRTILQYGYHISAAMYQYVCKQVFDKWMPFYLVFVQKQAPFDSIMVDMSNYGYRYYPEIDMVSLGPGAHEFKQLLDLHTRCLQEQTWPGAEEYIAGDKYRIMEIQPPMYYARKFTDTDYSF